MKTLLLVGTAILIASTNNVFAAKITFDNFCDGMKIVGDGRHYVSKQTGTCLQGTLIMGSGYKIGGKRRGGNIVLGVNWEAFDGHPAGSEQYSYIIQLPLQTGGTWEEIFTTDGSTMTILNSGTYTVVGGPVRGPVGPRLSFIPRH
jgi:hypothetical protein